MSERAKVYCENCEDWIAVTRSDARVECTCGQGFLVTITPLPSQTV